MDETTFDCPRCLIGHCHPRRINYLRLLGGRLLSIPGMTAHVCDICGYQLIDPGVQERIDRLEQTYQQVSPQDSTRRPEL